MIAETTNDKAGFASTDVDATAGFCLTTPEQAGLFGQALPTSVHTYESKPTTPLCAWERVLERRLSEGLSYYGRYSSAYAYDRSGFQGAPPSEGERDRRHGWWTDERSLVRAAMASAGFPLARVDRFDTCGAASFVLVQKVAPYRFKRACNKCRDRHCKPCSIERANLYAANIKKRLNQHVGRLERRFRFVTLTLKSNDEPLPKQFRRFMTAFAALRRVKLCNLRKRKLRNWWSNYVVGGCYFLEATFSRGRWHVHAHMIVEGAFLPQPELKALWHHVTGDSDVVDVRQLSSVDDVAAEVSKYAAKGAGAKLAAQGDKLVEWMIATKALRFCSTFGTWRGYRLSANLEEFNPGDWVNLGREDDIRAKAALRDPWALRVITSLEQDTDARKKSRPPPPK